LTPWERTVANLCIAGTLAGIAVALVVGSENFPLSNAVMFSRDVGSDRPRYTMHWYVNGDETETILHHLELSDRYFFQHFYGPTDTGPLYADTPTEAGWEALEERLVPWFEVFVGRYEEREKRGVESVRFEMRLENSKVRGAPIDYVVGTYHARRHEFRGVYRHVD